MKISYTGKADALTPAETRKIEARFSKFAKLLDAPKGEREAHVILTAERHLQNAEITVRYFEHSLVGVGSAPDLFTAITLAQEKLEKQILRLRGRFRDDHRAPKREFEAEGAETAEEQVLAETPATAQPAVFRINHHAGRKPMTLEEAMMAIEGRDYVVYHDAQSERVSVLVRRRDGNFDLIEA